MAVFDTYRRVLGGTSPVGLTGSVGAVRGLTVAVSDFPAPVDACCRIDSGSGGLEARVVGFAADQTLVMPVGATAGIRKGDRVVLTASRQAVGVSCRLLGRVLDARGQVIDGGGPVEPDARQPIWPGPIDPMRRRRITEAMPTGVRAIDAMLTVGRGQRMAIFSGSGLGKSVMLGMIARGAAADVVVVALIGERGREVRDFVERDLAGQVRERSVVVASTGDEPPLARVQAAGVAAAVAEYFRHRGANVLLVMDSLTRLAFAQRQIGLAGGQPPAARGLTPNVFSLLPELLERTGRTENGSVTGFYSVLDDGDDPSEPIGEAVRSVTDGHIRLSRELAGAAHWPAVDVVRSISRVTVDVADEEHQAAAREVRRLIAAYEQIEDLVNIGAYRAGSNETFDLAIRAMPWIRAFLEQPVDQPVGFDRTRADLNELAERIRWAKVQSRRDGGPAKQRPGDAT